MTEAEARAATEALRRLRSERDQLAVRLQAAYVRHRELVEANRRLRWEVTRLREGRDRWKAKAADRSERCHRWRQEARRQRARAEEWRHRALKLAEYRPGTVSELWKTLRALDTAP